MHPLPREATENAGGIFFGYPSFFGNWGDLPSKRIQPSVPLLSFATSGHAPCFDCILTAFCCTALGPRISSAGDRLLGVSQILCIKIIFRSHSVQRRGGNGLGIIGRFSNCCILLHTPFFFGARRGHIHPSSWGRPNETKRNKLVIANGHPLGINTYNGVKEEESPAIIGWKMGTGLNQDRVDVNTDVPLIATIDKNRFKARSRPPVLLLGTAKSGIKDHHSTNEIAWTVYQINVTGILSMHAITVVREIWRSP